MDFAIQTLGWIAGTVHALVMLVTHHEGYHGQVGKLAQSSEPDQGMSSHSSIPRFAERFRFITYRPLSDVVQQSANT
jgi:hypothetical protein